jgi:uncharacterized protein with HEPN domain
MPRDDQYLLDILQAAELVMKYVEGISKEEFWEDSQCQDAVMRRLEIIGEAARRISSETRSKFPDLPWDEMTRMRNFLIHEYDDVDLNIVWDTVLKDIPPLLKILREIFKGT